MAIKPRQCLIKITAWALNKLLKKQTDGAACEVCAAKRIATKGFTDKVSKELQFEKQGGANASQYQIVQELVNQ